jgi:hypothetical protein
MPDAWYEQDSILGDFVRAVRELEASCEPLDLSSSVDAAHAGSLREAVSINDPKLRQAVLREAAILGVDLLGGGEDER